MLDNDTYSSPLHPLGKGLSAERALRAAIVHGVLQPGERLSETGLCQQFAIGRAAVRVALAQLQERGFVASAARTGWHVTPVSAAEIREVMAGRHRLEPLLTSVVLSDSDRSHLAQLGEMYAALSARADMGKELQPTLRRYERDMMQLLADRLGMPGIAGWLVDLLDRSTRLVLFFEAQGAPGLRPADRASLADALIRGDAIVAAQSISATIGELEAHLGACFMASAASMAGAARVRPGKGEARTKPARDRAKPETSNPADR